MSMANTMLGYSSTRLHVKRYPMSRTLLWNPISKLAVSTHKNQTCFSGDNMKVQLDMKSKRNFSVHANTGPVPGAPVPVPGPCGPPSNSIRSWIVGMVFSLILPFFTNKWGPLWVLKNRIDSAVQSVEDIVETIEKVAEGVDKAAEKMAHDLPEGKLKDLVEFVEHAAERAAKDADTIDDLIDKVQEAEEEAVCVVGSIVNEAKKSPEGAKDGSKHS